MWLEFVLQYFFFSSSVVFLIMKFSWNWENEKSQKRSLDPEIKALGPSFCAPKRSITFSSLMYVHKFFTSYQKKNNRIERQKSLKRCKKGFENTKEDLHTLWCEHRRWNRKEGNEKSLLIFSISPWLNLMCGASRQINFEWGIRIHYRTWSSSPCLFLYHQLLISATNFTWHFPAWNEIK